MYQTAQHMTLRRVVFVFVYFELIHSQLYGPKMTEKLLFFPIFILIISRLPIIQFWKIRALWAPLGELYTLEMVKTHRIRFSKNFIFWGKTPKFRFSWRIGKSGQKSQKWNFMDFDLFHRVEHDETISESSYFPKLDYWSRDMIKIKIGKKSSFLVILGPYNCECIIANLMYQIK